MVGSLETMNGSPTLMLLSLEGALVKGLGYNLSGPILVDLPKLDIYV